MKKTIITTQAISELSKSANDELYAEYLYRNLSNQMQTIGYLGAQQFFKKEAENEAKHYQKIIDFANDCGGIISLSVIVPFEKTAKTLRDAMQFAYDAEKDLQDKYEARANRFINEHTVYQRLLFFIKEQRKSVGEYGDLLARIDLCKEDPGALLQIDKELE